MSAVLTNDFLLWYGELTRFRYLRGPRGVDMGKHTHPTARDETTILSIPDREPTAVFAVHEQDNTDVFYYRGYHCEGCGDSWASLESGAGNQPNELFCLATKGCEGPVVALYPVDEPPPSWVPVLLRGGKR